MCLMALAKFAVSIAANYQNYFLHLEFIEVNFLHRKDYSKELESAVMVLGVQFSVLHYFLRKIIILSQSSEVFQIGKNFLPEELSCSSSSHHNFKSVMVLDFTQTNSEHSTKVALVMVTISTQN